MIHQPILSSNTGARSWLSWRSALIIGITLLIYLPAIRSSFIWDDDAYVINNTALRSLRGLWEIWFQPGRLDQYYPLTYSSFWVEYHLWKLHPLGYHMINVLFHALNSLLVWRLLERLKVPGAWFAGLLFLVHPVHVESVAWITERKNVLSGFFYLLSFLAYLRFKNEESANRPWYFYSFFFFLAALLGKTITVTFPVAVILVLWWKDGKCSQKDLVRLLPFLAATAALGFITASLENRHIVTLGTSEWDFSFLERLLIAGRALWFYLGKLVWPYPLIFIYPRWEIDPSALWQWFFPLSFMLLLFLSWRFRSRWGRGPLTALAFFAVTLFPALGFKSFFPMWFSFVADHFQYLASIAPLALGSAVCLKAFGKYPRIRTWLAAAVLMIFSVLTWQQCHIYKNLFTLWQDTLKKNPSAWIAHNNISSALIENGRYQEAVSHVEEAIRLKPNYATAYRNLGVLAAKRNDLKKAVEYHRRAVQLQPNSGDFYNALGMALLRSGQMDEAIEHFFKAIAFEPHFAMPRCNLGDALMIKGEIENAIRWYRKALALDPDYVNALTNLGLALFKTGQTDNAIDLYRKALKLDPNRGMTHRNLAEALASKGFTGEAERHILEAIRLAPGNTDFRVYYAAFLEQHGKVDEAIKQYNEIIRLDPKNPVAQRNLRRIAFRDFKI